MNPFRLNINLLVVLFFVGLGFLGLVDNSVLANTESEKNANKIREYSDDLDQVLLLAKKHFNVNSVSIAGGTARSFIKLVMNQEPLVFRDFDIVLSSEKSISKDDAERFALDLEKSKLGKYLKENLRPRPRYNPKISDYDRAKKYNAGFGFFILSPTGTEYDISIYHSEFDLSLNGIMDVDQFQIKLKEGLSLEKIIKSKSLFLDSLVDPNQALEKVINNKVPQVVNWNAVSLDPCMISIRIIRTLSKFNALPLDQLTEQRLKKLIEKQIRTDSETLQVSRNLLKVLEDSAWVEELIAIKKVGLFDTFFKSFGNSIQYLDRKKYSKLQRLSNIFKYADPDDVNLFLKTIRPLQKQLVEEIKTVYSNSKLNECVGFYQN